VRFLVIGIGYFLLDRVPFHPNVDFVEVFPKWSEVRACPPPHHQRFFPSTLPSHQFPQRNRVSPLILPLKKRFWKRVFFPFACGLFLFWAPPPTPHLIIRCDELVLLISIDLSVPLPLRKDHRCSCLQLRCSYALLSVAFPPPTLYLLFGVPQTNNSLEYPWHALAAFPPLSKPNTTSLFTRRFFSSGLLWLPSLQRTPSVHPTAPGNISSLSTPITSRYALAAVLCVLCQSFFHPSLFVP